MTFTNVHAQLPPRPNTIILLSMPADEAEFKNIFQRNPTQDEMKNITTLLNENKNLKNVYLLKKEDDVDKVMEVLWKNYADKKDDIAFPKIGFSLVGHNDNGNFYFPNGKTLKLEEIEKKFEGFPAMFLSCNSKTYLPNSIAIDYKLTYNEAINIANDFDNIITLHCADYLKMTPRKVAEKMMNNLNTIHKVKYTAKFLGAAGGMSGTFVLLKELDTDKPEAAVDSTSAKKNE